MFDGRDEIIDLFEKGTFPSKGNVFKTKEKEELEENKFFEYIENESKGINYYLFEKHFNLVAPTVFSKKLYERKDKKKNKEFVNVIKSGLCDLKDEIKKLSEDEKKDEQPDKILKTIRTRIKNFNTRPNA